MTSIKEVKVTYDKWGDDYDSYIAEEKKFSEEAAYCDKIFRKHGVKSVHDCGCGTGRHTTYFAEWGYYTEGSDLSEGMLAQARERAREKGLDIKFTQAAFQELNEKISTKFDGIICAGLGIAHIIDEKELQKSLANIYQIMNPGGVVIFENRRLEEFIGEGNKMHFGPLQVFDKQGRKTLNFRVLSYDGNNTASYNVLSFAEKDDEAWDYDVRTFPIRTDITRKLQETLPKIGFSKVDVIKGAEFLPEHGKTDLTVAVK